MEFNFSLHQFNNSGQLEMSKDIKKLNSRIEKANQLALDAWGRGIENRKWLESERKTM
ncbi:MAG: hypothetical protein K2L18_04085 [Acetatifactor sp.]|nr:hypothetical protein [Acetatifactor sp.]